VPVSGQNGVQFMIIPTARSTTSCRGHTYLTQPFGMWPENSAYLTKRRAGSAFQGIDRRPGQRIRYASGV